MLQLIQGLARCNQEKFYGWRIGAATVDIEKEDGCYLSTNEQYRHGCRIITVMVTTKNKDICQRLQCVIWPPAAGERKVAETDVDMRVYPDTVYRLRHRFSREEIRQYIAQSGDLNPIHQGERPIVPGLCIAWYVQRTLACPSIHWKISFHRPVYAGDILTMMQDKKRITGYVYNKRVCTIRILRK